MTEQQNPVALQQQPQLSGEDAALALLAQQFGAQTENSDRQMPAVETTESKPGEKKPDPKEPPKEPSKAQLKLEIERELRTKMSSQFAALERKTSTLTERDKKIAEREQEIDGLKSIVDMVRYAARRSGQSEHAVWQDVIDQIRNDGKRSPEAETRSEVAQLRKEREHEKREREEQQRQNEAARYAQTEAEAKDTWRKGSIDLAISDSDRWPRMSQLPKFMIGEQSLAITIEAFNRSGQVPEMSEVLDYLESQFEKEQAANPALAKGGAQTQPKEAPKRAQTIDNRTAVTAPNLADLTAEQREELAARNLEALIRAAG